MGSQSKQYVEALLLDINILCLIIERNRKQHSRTSYFRRLDMLTRSLKRFNVVKMDASQENNFTSLSEKYDAVGNERDRIVSLLERYKGVHKRRGAKSKIEEEQWSISVATKDGECEYECTFMIDLKHLHAALTLHLPEILSRITFAASSLYTELSRGYFAPLCTVALACISRIRVLILRMGRDIYSILQQTMGMLENDFLATVSKGGDLEKQTDLTVQSVKNLICGWKVQPDLLNNFMDVDYKDHLVEMGKRKLQKVMQRGESNGSFTTDNYDSENVEDVGSKEDESLAIERNEEDIVGELVDVSGTKPQSFRDEELVATCVPEKKESGDRNLEIVVLMKEKFKSIKPKKRKNDNNANEEILIIEKRAKVNKTSTKAEKKRKKKKRSKDVIDAIFDGF